MHRLSSSRRRARSAGLLALAALLVAAAWLVAPVKAAPATEVRGLWVLRTSLGTPAQIARMVRDAAGFGFNTLFVQARGRGDAYFRGGIEPPGEPLGFQPAGFDPLAQVIAESKAHGLRVHAWINVNLVSSAHELPVSRDHVLRRHPEWLMVPRALTSELEGVEPRNPAYLGKVARWARQPSNALEGLYASPILPGYADYTTAVIADIAQRYAVDGIHLDYIRYPGKDFDYSAGALSEFRTSLLPDLPAAERARLDRKLAADPFAYADMFPMRWANFRRGRLTNLVMQIRAAVKVRKPAIALSAAVNPDGEQATDERYQDWALWFDAGVLDAVCPMVYTPDADEFRARVDALARSGARDRIWTGIGAYRLTPDQTIANIEAARRARTAGVILFSYDSLTGPAQLVPDYLSRVSRAAFSTPTTTSVLGR